MARTITNAAAIKAAKLSSFTPNSGQTHAAYADAQMKGRGTAYSRGNFQDTGQKLVEAHAVNGVAFVTYSRIKLEGVEKLGYQVVAYDLAGNVIVQTPADDTAPKSDSAGRKVLGPILAELRGRRDLVLAAIEGAANKAREHAEFLDGIVAQLKAAQPQAQAEGAEGEEEAVTEEA